MNGLVQSVILNVNLSVQRMEQTTDISKLAIALAFLVGVVFLIIGIVKMVRKGAKPRHRRGWAIASFLLGAVLLALPGIVSAYRDPGGDQVPSDALMRQPF